MGRPSITAEVKARLDAYLADIDSSFRAQNSGAQTPTLPLTNDGKVNVRAVAQAVELRQTQEKYLYERDELRDLINAVAAHQGVAPIGFRLTPKTQVPPSIALLEQRAREGAAAAKAAVEAHAVQAELLQQLQHASAEVQTLRAENLRLRSELDAIHSGIFLGVLP